MYNEKKVNGAKTGAEKFPVGIEESAQYEVFKNGDLERDTIAKWLRNDLQSMLALVDTLLREKSANDALVDVLYDRYKKFHSQQRDIENVEGSVN